MEIQTLKGMTQDQVKKFGGHINHFIDKQNEAIVA